MSVRQITAEVAEVFGVSAIDIAGEGRTRPIARARFATAWLARNRLGYSFSRIGKALNRDHTSILHGIGRCEELRTNDLEFRMLTDQLIGEKLRCPCCGGALP